MPETLVCPECQRKMRLPDGVIGKKVKCPTCAAVFVASAPEASAVPMPAPAPAPMVEPVDREESVSPPPRRSWSSSRAEQDEPEVSAAPLSGGTPAEVENEALAWQSVQAGLKFHAAGHICYLAGIFFFLVLFIVISTASEPPAERDIRMGRPPPRSSGPSVGVVGTLAVFMVLGIVGSFVGGMVGSSFGLAAPLKYGTRGMSVAGLVLTGIAVLLFAQATTAVVVTVAEAISGQLRPERESLLRFSLLFVVLFDVARLTLLALFLRGVAACTRFRRAASSAKALSIVTPSVLLGSTAVDLLLRQITDPGIAVRVVLVVLVCAAWIVVLVLGLALLVRSIRNIDRAFAP